MNAEIIFQDFAARPFLLFCPYLGNYINEKCLLLISAILGDIDV
jgi:hypothetical protein